VKLSLQSLGVSALGARNFEIKL